MLEVLAFAKALVPYVPLAVAGLDTAKELVLFGVNAIGDMIEGERAPTEDEWYQLNTKIRELRAKLHSDEM